jgi:hypothetical protein
LQSRQSISFPKQAYPLSFCSPGFFISFQEIDAGSCA